MSQHQWSSLKRQRTLWNQMADAIPAAGNVQAPFRMKCQMRSTLFSPCNAIPAKGNCQRRDKRKRCHESSSRNTYRGHRVGISHNKGFRGNIQWLHFPTKMFWKSVNCLHLFMKPSDFQKSMKPSDFQKSMKTIGRQSKSANRFHGNPFKPFKTL